MTSAKIAETQKSGLMSPRNDRQTAGWRIPRRTVLRFTPTAWAKLLYLRDAGETEVSGFGISSARDLLLVEEIRLVRQTCTAVSVKFDDVAVADYFDEQVDSGRPLEQFARIWIHTHPGNSAEPSSTDETTFTRCFGQADWALMFILAMGGQSYARLRFNVGPGGSLILPVEIDFQNPFPASDSDAWDQEYLENVVALTAQAPTALADRSSLWAEELEFLDVWEDYVGSDNGPFIYGDQYDPYG